MVGEEEKGDEREKKSGHRRVSSLNAASLLMKKSVASKVGESKVGRSTLIRFMGPEADELVSALKEAVTKFSSRETAKELKKDTMKWVLKASVLAQSQALNKDNTAHLFKPALVCAERLVGAYDAAPCGERVVQRVSDDFRKLAPLLREALEPHSKDSNVDKVDKLVLFYSEPAFLDKLLNDPALAEEARTVVESVRQILAPFPSVLDDTDALRSAAARYALVLEELKDRLPFEMCMERAHPELGALFATYLDTAADRQLGLMLRFLLAEREFVLISAANLRASRARALCAKFLDSGLGDGDGGGGEPRLSVSPHELDKLEDAISGQRVTKSSFHAIAAPLEAKLRDTWGLFLSSKVFLNYKQGLRLEAAGLEDTWGSRLSAVSSSDSGSPAHGADVAGGATGAAAPQPPKKPASPTAAATSPAPKSPGLFFRKSPKAQ